MQPSQPGLYCSVDTLQVVASPSDGKVRTAAEIGHNEILDYEMICFEVLHRTALNNI